MSYEINPDHIVEPNLQVYIDTDLDEFDRDYPADTVHRAAVHRALLLDCTKKTPCTLIVWPEDVAIHLWAYLRVTDRSFRHCIMEALIRDAENGERIGEGTQILRCSSKDQTKHVPMAVGLYKAYIQAEDAVRRLVPENVAKDLDRNSGVLFSETLDSYTIVRGEERPELPCYEFDFAGNAKVVESRPYHPGLIIREGVLNKYYGPGGDVVIPKSVTSIGWSAFKGCSSLTSITIPESVKSIGWYAFSDCKSLAGVTIPESVKRIGDEAFSGCSSLTSVTIRNSETEIGEKAFSGCTELVSFTIPAELNRLGKDPFGDKLPAGLIPALGTLEHALTEGSIKKYMINEETWERLDPDFRGNYFLSHRSKGLAEAFANCISVKSAGEIGGQILKMLTGKASSQECAGAGYYLTTLYEKAAPQLLLDVYHRLQTEKSGGRALKTAEGTPALMMKLRASEGNEAAAREEAWNLALKNFRIEEGVVKAYLGKSPDVVIPEGVTAIGDQAFKDCGKITSVTIPEGVTEIGEEAFMGCQALRSISIPEGVTRFGKRAFTFSGLEKVTIPGSAEAISFGMFGYCRQLKKIIISEGVKRIDYGAFLDCRSLKTVAIPESVEGIGDWAFQDCGGLERVSVPEHLTEMGKGAFICCNRLADPQGFVIINGILFDYILQNQTDVVIPEGVRTISGRVFYRCSNLRSVTIPESVTSIGEEVFQDCYRLQNVNLPEGVTTIGAAAFRGCSNLRLMRIPQKLNQEMLGKAWLFFTLDEATMSNLISRAKDLSKEEREAFYNQYLVSDTRAAMLLAEKRKELDAYASMRGLSVDELRDRYLSDLGLDMRGRKSYNLGNETVTVRMEPDFSFTVELPDGKTAKSLPKKGSDPTLFDAASKDFAQTKKDARKIWKNRADLLLADFISGKERTADYWKKVYNSNPILRGVACLLVWEQGGKTFRCTDDGLVTADGSVYELSEEPIRLAHPIELDKVELEAWQRHFTAHSLKQPFAQIWERAYTPEEIAPDRYAGCPILFFQLQGAGKHGFDHELRIPGCVIEAKWSSEAAPNGNQVSYCDIRSFDIQTFSRAVNHALAYLDRVTILGRIQKDDADVMKSVEGCNLAQAADYIAAAQEAQAVNVLALLLDYKNAHFADFDPMDEFTLEW